MTITNQDLQSHIDAQTYDKLYQDIEVLGFVGYTDAHLSWDRISKFDINWKGATVCDLGCFHAYFGIKSLREGAAKVIGLENSVTVIETAKLICQLSDAEIELMQWSGGDEMPECDIALCLNMLHHCPDQEAVISKMHCDYAVFEINPDQVDMVKKYFKPISDVASHRINSKDSLPRRVMHMKRRAL